MSNFVGYRRFGYDSRKPDSDKRKRMLNMGRVKYFRYDLDELLAKFNLGDNKDTIFATLLNNMTKRSMDDAFDYIDRLESAKTLDKGKVDELKVLLRRYSRWR